MKHFGLVGRSLGHSFSQGYFTEKFAGLGLVDYRYQNFELGAIDEFPRLVNQTPDLRGLNVTIPYKEAIIPYLDRLSTAAKSIQAVNTIEFVAGELVGHNTDVIGFELALKQLIGTSAMPTGALVLGSGGAAKAVGYVLAKAQIPFRIVSRKGGKGALTYDALKSQNNLPELLVNTTPVGTFPALNDMPDVPVHLLGTRHLVIDLIYNPATTALLHAANARGAKTLNGLPMLHAQAEASWKIWSNSNAL